MPRSRWTRVAAVLWIALLAASASAQIAFEQEPINYGKAPSHDPVAQLQRKIDSGETSLPFHERFGYLNALLEALEVSPTSQGLVFSKTSFQLKRISPRSPRAVYFADDTYVGWVPGGDVLELIAVDPQQGPLFYSLSQREKAKPQFRKHTHECLQCHASSLTLGVPGPLVRSVFAAPDGNPVLSAGTFVTDHTSPLKERWGGWYVTGKHGQMRHMGNAFLRGNDPEQFDTGPGANVTELDDRFDTDRYLAPHSDIVALMLLEHQVQMHNHITRANYQSRLALRDERIINEMLQRETTERSPSTLRRFDGVGRPLLKYLLFVEEIELRSPIEGAAAFADQFAQRGPHDAQGRSLRQLDLTSRLMKYPCSYLIYSPAFDGLPAEFKSHLYRQLWDILNGADTSDDFAALSAADRKAVLEILLATKDNLPDYWRQK